MNNLFFKKGIAHVGMLVLFLAVGALVATVFVAKSGTGFTNMAFDKKPLMRVGLPTSTSLSVTEIGKVEMANDQYSLLTVDGRKYQLSGFNLLSNFVGKTVLVDGTMKRQSKGKCFLPERCAGSWWPLPDGLTFNVRKLQEAEKKESGNYDIKFSAIKTGTYAMKNVFISPNSGGVGNPTFVRSSVLNLSGFVDKNVSAYGDVYYVGSGPDKFINVFSITVDGQTPPPDREPVDPINKPSIIGTACSSDQDCKMTRCKAPFMCPQTNATAVCVDKKCQIKSLEW